MENSKKIKLRHTDILRILLLIIFGAILGINVYSLNANRLVGNRMPMPFGYGAAVVLSGSMEPMLSVDDLIIIKKVDRPAINDIVVFQDENILVVHRVIETDGETVITKGDANNIADEPISISDIKGKVILKLPFVGKIVNFIKTPIGVLLVIAAAVVLVEIPQRRERQKHFANRQKIIDEIERLKQERKN